MLKTVYEFAYKCEVISNLSTRTSILRQNCQCQTAAYKDEETLCDVHVRFRLLDLRL
jgi:hypothetical protein